MKTTRTQTKLSKGTFLKAQFIDLRETNDGTRYRLRFLVLDDKLQLSEMYCTNTTYTQKEVSTIMRGKSTESMRNSHWKVMLSTNPFNDKLLTITQFQYDPSWVIPKWYIEYSEKYQNQLNSDRSNTSKEKLAYLNKRMKDDPKFARIQKIRKATNKLLRGEIEDSLAIRIFGCTCEQFQRHIKKQLTKDMKFDDRSTYDLDHLVPLTRFDIMTDEGFLAACHYTNVRPLSPRDNEKKYNKIDTKGLTALEILLMDDEEKKKIFLPTK